MSISTLLFMFSAAGFALFVLAVVLLVASKEGRIVLTAKLSKTPLLISINPETRRVKLERIRDKELVEKKGDTYFLGGWPSYKWGGVNVFFVIKDDVVDYDPAVVAEVQKATAEGFENFEQLKDTIIEYVETEVKSIGPDGEEIVQKVQVPTLKMLRGRAHKVISMRFTKKGNIKAVIEEYTPIDFVVLSAFYNRKLSATTIKKILKIKDTEALIKVQKTYEKLLKKLGLEKKTGISFNPVYLIYIGIFVFIVLMGWSMYGGKILGGGAKPLPPSP